MDNSLKALQFLRTLAIRTSSLIKGGSYHNSEGKYVELLDKDRVAKSKKEIRDASGVFLREQVSRASLTSDSFRSKEGYIVIPINEWLDIIATCAQDSKEIVSQLAANNRAGLLSEGIITILGSEMVEMHYVKSLEECISKQGLEIVSDEEPEIKKSSPKKAATSKAKGSKSKVSES